MYILQTYRTFPQLIFITTKNKRIILQISEQILFTGEEEYRFFASLDLNVRKRISILILMWIGHMKRLPKFGLGKLGVKALLGILSCWGVIY